MLTFGPDREAQNLPTNRINALKIVCICLESQYLLLVFQSDKTPTRNKLMKVRSRLFIFKDFFLVK